VRRQPLLFFCVINQGIFAALVVINSFPSERLLVLRERAAGTYYASAYFMAKVAAELTTQLPIPIIFSCIVYWLAGLAPTAGQFFVFVGFMVLCNMAATSLALMVSTWCRNVDMAISVRTAGPGGGASSRHVAQRYPCPWVSGALLLCIVFCFHKIQTRRGMYPSTDGCSWCREHDINNLQVLATQALSFSLTASLIH
jgi:hypothetical protein